MSPSFYNQLNYYAKMTDFTKLQDSKTLRKELGIDIRWRALSNKGGITKLCAYQDARDVQKVLDHVCGPDNWENEPLNLNGKMYMQIRIRTENGWVSKSDVGTETNVEAVKGEASDAFKRAAVMFGIFRDLYDMDYIVLKNDGRDPLTPEGVALKTPEAVNLYCNNISAPMGLLRKLYGLLKPGVDRPENADVLEALSKIKDYVGRI